MKAKFKQRLRLIFLSAISTFFILTFAVHADQWINPKEYYKDNLDLVRNPKNKLKDKKGLTETEKQEIKKYGFTGLELMTYLFYNKETGNLDRDSFDRFYNITPDKKIFRTDFLDRFHSEYKDKTELVKLSPGDIFRR